jgi:predicted extracellular nuclease
MAPVTLIGTLYNETFDGIGTGLPSGWDIYTGATVSSPGTSATFTTTPATWASTTAGFKNFAAGDSLTSIATVAQQSAASDRALGIRQTGTFGDPGGSFVFSLNNTSGFQNFGLSFKAQMLDVQPRSTTWTADYRVGSSGNFTPLGTYTDPGVFGSTTLSTGSGLSAFGTDINNQSNPVQIRISALSASTGSGNRDSFGIDDFQLTYSTGDTTPPTSGAGVTVTESGGSTNITEGGATDDYSLVLNTQPTANVTININGGTQTTTSPITFTTTNWNTSQTVTVTAVDDTEVEGLHTQTITQTASSTDINYNGISIPSVTARITDNNTGIPITKISTIQGTGTTATPGTFTIEGIVVGDFQGTDQLGGFYLQEENADADNNVLTSEGIFVNSLVAVNFGDKVRVTGTVVENSSTPSFNQAVITPGTVSDVTVLAPGQQALVTPTAVDLPTTVLGDLERYEGMLVNFPETLTVTEVFNLGRFGEVSLSANGRLFNPTNIVDPNDNPASGTNSTGSSNVAAVTALQDLNNRSRIILDDGSSASNLSDVPYIDTTDANPLNDTLRIGSTTTGLTGVLSFGFSNYRIQPTQTPTFDYAARPTLPTVGGNVKVGSFNVLNYFNGNGAGGGFPTSRGADTAVEFSRQRAKIVAAIQQLNTDVVGLIEIENDGDGANSAIADLVNGLNTATGAGTYAFVPLANTTGSSGTDEIKVAFIYKPGAVTPVGNAIYFNDSAFNSARPPLAQTFKVNTTEETFTPIINHFKSKGSSAGLPGDTDQGDGQGLSNATRKAQSTALLNFISQVQTASGDSDVMVLGDLNAYGEEDPIDILRAGGLTKLVTSTDSYVFDGQTGSLDHALVTSSLLAQVTGAAKWNINADEPIILDYNDDVLTSGEAAAEDRNDTSLYQANPFRSSDHDPVLVGLNLPKKLTGNAREPLTGTSGNDQITGNPGAKTLTGNGGDDLFVFNSIKDAGQTITDFTSGDKIVLTGLLDTLVSGGYNGTNALAEGYVRIVQGSSANSANSILQIDRDGLSGSAIFRPFLQVNNITATALGSVNNFVF